jgi:DNA invertase Pin-like site-specific DNA recombinase
LAPYRAGPPTFSSALHFIPLQIDEYRISHFNMYARGNLNEKKRAALYVRVSSGEQHTEPQERALRDYVQRRGWLQHKIHRDKGISGSTSSRPGLDEVLKDYRRRTIDVVVVWKFDRFARSLKNLIAGFELCRALKIDLVSVN